MWIAAAKRLFSGRKIVLPALVYIALLTLVRNTFVARTLGPEQFGLAVIFLLAQQLIDATTDTGLNKFLLQSSIGNRPSVQAMVQLIAGVRGVIIAVVLVGVAWPISTALHFTVSVTPFVMLAVMAISTGLLHYDNVRQQRNQVFVNDSLSNVFGETAAIVTVIVVLNFTKIYIVAVIAIMVRSVATTIMSHILSKRRYRMRYTAALAAIIFAFSWPLLVNGPLMFFSAQADRLLVGRFLGVRELGLYSAALLLMFFPLSLGTRLLGTIFVPRLSAEFRTGLSDDVETEFIGTSMTLYLVAATGFAAAGPTAIALLYGPSYGQHMLPVALIGVTQAMRFLRTWPSSMALSVARTGNLLFSNIIRLIALPMGAAGILLGDGIVGLTSGLLIGESIAMIIGVMTLNRSRHMQISKHIAKLIVAFVVAAIIPLFICLANPTPAMLAVIMAATLVLALATLHLIDRRLIPRNLAAFGW